MTRRRLSFTAAQKAEAVRKHFKGHIPVSQISEEMAVQPTMIHNWINTALKPRSSPQGGQQGVSVRRD